ncbi:MAG: outer membrane beta-barrel protein [Proteobacteria bacterium]|nr:outer membrane beta-barrel protein [Pseudomonadota bacterium]
MRNVVNLALLVATSALMAAPPAAAQPAERPAAVAPSASTDRSSELPASTPPVAASGAVAAPPAPRVPPLPLDQGWNSNWGFLLSLNNIFQNGSFLTTYGGMGAAGYYAFKPDLMLRLGVTLWRNSSPLFIQEQTRETAGEKLATYTVGNGASGLGFNGRGDLLWRLSPKAVAPYLGAGLFLDSTHSRQTRDDEVSVVDQITRFRSRDTIIALGARGMGGAEWRLHPNFALFAEYELSVSFLTWTSSSSSTTVENSEGGVRTVTRTASNSARTSWLTWGNTLAQGASLGLIVLF